MRVFVYKEAAGGRDILILPGPASGLRPSVLKGVTREALEGTVGPVVAAVLRVERPEPAAE